MPFVHLKLAIRDITDHQRAQLHSGLTQLMEKTLRKQAQLTVVAIDHEAAGGWSVGGISLPEGAWAAQLEVYVTAGTNTAEERGRFIAQSHALLNELWDGPPAAPLLHRHP